MIKTAPHQVPSKLPKQMQVQIDRTTNTVIKVGLVLKTTLQSCSTSPLREAPMQVKLKCSNLASLGSVTQVIISNFLNKIAHLMPTRTLKLKLSSLVSVTSKTTSTIATC